MNINLLKKEIARNSLSLIMWMIIVTLLISVTMSFYTIFMENQSRVFGMLNIIPSGVLQFKGISNLNDLLSPMGFYAVNNIIYMMVLGSIYSISLSSNIFLKEEYNKTAEYLLTRPVTRNEVFLTKTAVVFINILLLNLVTSAAGFILIEIVKNGSFSISAFLILSLYTFLLNLLFGSLGLILSTAIKRPRPITAFCIGLVLILYFIFTISKIPGSISNLGYISPFRFVNTEVVSPGYKLEFLNLMYFIGFSSLLFILSFRRFLTRDIYT